MPHLLPQHLLVALAVSGSMVAELRAAEPSPENKREAAQTVAEEARISTLIEQLGEPSFDVREQASRALVKVGPPARPALLEASESPNLEIRYRARSVLRVVEKQRHEARLQSFLKNRERPDNVLPGWKRYRETVGDDDASRKFFVGMQRAERDLFTALEKQDPDLDEAFLRRCSEIQFRLTSLNRRFIEAERAAAMLFLAGDPEIEMDTATQTRVVSFCNYNEFASTIQSGARSGLAKRILSGWITRDDDADVQVLYQRIQLATRYGLSGGLAPARQLLEKKNTDNRAQYALLAVGRFGGEAELPLVESMFDTTTLLTRQTKPPYTCQIRDVALAVALHITKQDANKYGFARKLQKQGYYIFQLNSAGFGDDTKRKAAFEKYAKWRSENPDGDASQSE